MSKVTVKSPSPTYNGITAGVSFADGEGTFDPSRQHAAARYFDRHGYTYDRTPAAAEPVVEQPASSEPAESEPATGEQTGEPGDDSTATADAADADAPAESEPATADVEPAKPARSSKASKTAGQ